MGLRRLDGTAFVEMARRRPLGGPGHRGHAPGRLGILLPALPGTPDSPLPPTGETVGFALSLLAGVIVAPFGEEILFRAFATTAWVRGLGERRGLVQAALVFAVAHVLTISGTHGRRGLRARRGRVRAAIPVALALGWVFLRRGTIWASFGLHAAFNGILLILAEAASRPICARGW